MTKLSTDEESIRTVALDYIEGWFEGSAERMARSLHPELVKRSLRLDPETGEESLNHITKDIMVGYTKQGGGKDIPRDKVFYNIDIRDIDDEMAVVRVESYGYLDHLHLVKDKGQWQIVNVLYKRMPTD